MNSKSGLFQPYKSWYTLAIVAVCVLPLLLALVAPFNWAEQGDLIHTLLEFSAFGISLVTFCLALIHFSITREAATWVIGLAFFCSGLVDAMHVLVGNRMISSSLALEDLLPFTWAISRLLHILFLIVGITIYYFYAPKRSIRQWVIISVLMILSSVLIMCFTIKADILPQTQYGEHLITRPFDMIPLVLFVLAAVFIYPRFHRRAQSRFTFALILTGMVDISIQLYMSFGSSKLNDHFFFSAHGLKVFSYMIPFIGLSIDYRRSLRGKLRAQTTLQAAYNAVPDLLFLINKDGIFIDYKPADDFATRGFSRQKYQRGDAAIGRGGPEKHQPGH